MTGSQSVRYRARQIRLLLLDVDGVMTDGKLYYGNQGEELKAFNIQDGLGIKLLQRGGIEVGIITGRRSDLLTRRAEELGIQKIIQGREDKLTALNELIEQQDADSTPYALHEIAFMGDDLPDLAVIRTVGLGTTVANGSTIVAEHAHWQSSKAGGSGAVRELAEMLLSSQGKLDALLSDYL